MASDVFAFTKTFQKKIVKLFLIDQDFISRFHNLVIPNYFEDKSFEFIYSVLLDYYTKYETLPSQSTLFEELRHVKTIREISQEEFTIYQEAAKSIYKTKVVDIKFIEDKIVEFAKNQAMKHFILESTDLVLRGDYDQVNAKLDKAISVGNHLLNTGMNFLSKEEIDFRIKNRVDGLRNDAIPTGIEKLDESLKGGLCKSETGIIVGPPGRGKSIFLINMAKTAIRLGKVVFFYTLELSEKRIANRFDAALCKVTYHRLNEYPKKVRNRLKNLLNKVHAHLQIKYLPYEESTVLDIKAHIKNMKSKDGLTPDMIIIDYGDIMRPCRYSYKEKRHEQANIFSEICALAIEEDVPCWTASQGNKESLKKEIVDMSNMAEAFAKANRCDVVLGLCQSKPESDDQKARIFTSKVRDAEDKKLIPIHFDKARMNITYDKERDEEECES